MNQSEFNSVEAELREIEEEFASGQMNAFGTATTKENFVRELRKIADIETQVFYKACGLLSASSAEDYLMRAMMFTAAEPPGTPGSNSSNNNTAGNNNSNNNNNTAGNTSEDGSTNTGAARTTKVENGNSINNNNNANKSMNSNNNNNNNNMSNNNAGDRSTNFSKFPGRDSIANSRQDSFVDDPTPSREDDGPHTTQMGGNNSAGGSPLQEDGPPPWSSEAGFADRPFQDVARHFKMLESEFTAIGDHLRQISTHVLQLNDIAERVRSNASSHGL